MVGDDVVQLAAATLALCRTRLVTLATAESCTGGLIAAVLTSIAGSSDVVECGFVTYSNEAKAELLGVARELIEAHGAVSEPVAAQMAEGAVRRSRATVAVAVTGVAGPGGGSPEKPVGMVWFGAHRRDGATLTEHRLLPGDRGAIRAASVVEALRLVQRLI